jgi:hypothetical protein
MIKRKCAVACPHAGQGEIPPSPASSPYLLDLDAPDGRANQLGVQPDGARVPRSTPSALSPTVCCNVECRCRMARLAFLPDRFDVFVVDYFLVGSH